MGAACKRCVLAFEQKYSQQLISPADLGPGRLVERGLDCICLSRYRCAFWGIIAPLSVHSFGVITEAVSSESECALNPCHPNMDLCPLDTCWKCSFYELSAAGRKGRGQGQLGSLGWTTEGEAAGWQHRLDGHKLE